MRVIATLALCIAAVSAVPLQSQRIVGGTVTSIETYPTIAALLYSSNGQNFFQDCVGTIINSRSILTAAHCPYGDTVSRWRVRFGSTRANSGGLIYNLATIIFHPHYDARIYDSDIAIMRTTSPISYSTVIQPASIASSNYVLGDNQVVWAAGWGSTTFGGPSSEQLRHVQVWTVNQATCSLRYNSVGFIITENMLCSGWLDVGGRDQCQGDSGGPLFHNGVVVGVYSFGYGCGRAMFPGVNTRVSHYTPWIQSNA